MRHLELAPRGVASVHRTASDGMKQRAASPGRSRSRRRHRLMDEPFGSARRDHALAPRCGAPADLGGDHRTVVFVTHSLDEALTLSDRVILLNDGVVSADTAVDLPRPRDPSTLIESREFLDLRLSL